MTPSLTRSRRWGRGDYFDVSFFASIFLVCEGRNTHLAAWHSPTRSEKSWFVASRMKLSPWKELVAEHHWYRNESMMFNLLDPLESSSVPQVDSLLTQEAAEPGREGFSGGTWRALGSSSPRIPSDSTGSRAPRGGGEMAAARCAEDVEAGPDTPRYRAAALQKGRVDRLGSTRGGRHRTQSRWKPLSCSRCSGVGSVWFWWVMFYRNRARHRCGLRRFAHIACRCRACYWGSCRRALHFSKNILCM